MHEPTSKPCRDLLREYAQAGAEAAFEEVVRRYIDFVHSVALRRVEGDVHEAKDVVQRVFLDLARQVRAHAGLLEAETFSLGGWLHRHTCFVTANLRRSEARRRQREQRAFAMSAEAPDFPPSPAAWQELAPELDHAVQQLPSADRDTLILRFYEQLDLRAVGAAFGISDDAAQKRVRRALERLRELLAQQGIAFSFATLAVLLEEKAVAAAPAEVTTAVVQHVSSLRPPAPPPPAPPAAPLLGGLAGKLALATIGMATLLALVLVIPVDRPGASSDAQSTDSDRAEGRVSSQAPVSQTAAGGLASRGIEGSATPTAALPSRPLLLSLIDADSGKPVPQVPVEYRGWEGEHFSRQRLVANTNGDCLVPVFEGTTRLELTTRLDGYADTRILWEPRNGATIPEAFSVSLEKPVPIGGTVVNPDGQPVVGAKVAFGHGETGSESSQDGAVSQRFAWVETETDAAGRWRMDRIGASMLSLIHGSASHPDFESPPVLSVSSDLGSLAALTNFTHVFQLRPGGTIAGKVVDPEGRPVAGATVSLGGFGDSGRREERTLADGTFLLRGGPSPPTLLTAVSEGFAPTTVSVPTKSDDEPFTLVLAPGKPLRLRVVDVQGQPVVGSHIWLDTMANGLRGTPEWLRAPPVQFDFNPRSDAEGRAVWENAPDRELTFDVHKPGYQRLIQAKVRPGTEENVLTLQPALVLHGRVTDKETGQPIPRFLTTLGCPQPTAPGERIRYFWGQNERQRVRFEGGEYRHSIEEPVLWGASEISYVLRIEAEGYASAVTRVVQPDEGEVTLDVALRRASSALVTVKTPEGQPAAGAQVILFSEGQRFAWTPGGFSEDGIELPMKADAQGQLPLSPDDSVVAVMVAHASGLAVVAPAQLESERLVSLQPWSSVEGTAWSRGQPAPGRTYTVSSLDVSEPVTLAQGAFTSTTDATGRFGFPRLPPGKYRIQHVPQLSDGAPVSVRGQSHIVEVSPGEKVQIDLGKQDRPLRLRLRFPAPETHPVRFVSLLTPRPMAPAHVLTNTRALHAWASRPEVYNVTVNGRVIGLVSTPDGTWSATDVTPGPYILHLGIQTNQGPGRTPPQLYRAEVVIPEGAGDETVDLGEVPVALAE